MTNTSLLMHTKAMIGIELIYQFAQARPAQIVQRHTIGLVDLPEHAEHRCVDLQNQSKSIFVRTSRTFAMFILDITR